MTMAKTVTRRRRAPRVNLLQAERQMAANPNLARYTASREDAQNFQEVSLAGNLPQALAAATANPAGAAASTAATANPAGAATSTATIPDKTPVAPGDPLVVPSSGANITSGTLAIQSILETIGIDPTTAAAQASNLLSALNQSGLDPTSPTDSSSVQAYVDAWLPQQKFYQDRFPGIIAQLKAGQQPITVQAYIGLEDTMKGIAKQYGLDPNVMASPAVIADMVVSNKSAAEMSARFNTYMAQYETEAPEVQNAFNQFYGINGPTAYAAAIANPDITDAQLKQNMDVASISGAASSLGVGVGQSTATKLAQLGVSYQSALTAAANTVKQAGLYTPTMGEKSQETGPGAMTPVTQEALFASNAKVASAASTGSGAANDQAIQTEIENRQAQFRGGGGASSTQAEGYSGLGSTKAF